MSAPYRYYNGGDGWRYCYASRVSVTCPTAGREAEDARVGNAALALECDEAKLARILNRAHGGRSLRERDEDGRFTGRCAICGATLERRGFRAWRERLKDAPGSAGERIGEALGMPVVERDPERRFDLKREAIEWAREEAKISRAIAAEERAK